MRQKREYSTPGDTIVLSDYYLLLMFRAKPLRCDGTKAVAVRTYVPPYFMLVFSRRQSIEPLHVGLVESQAT